LKQYQEREFYQTEKERIREISLLIQNERHEEALRQLLLDTDESCGGLVYYNKIKFGKNDNTEQADGEKLKAIDRHEDKSYVPPKNDPMKSPQNQNSKRVLEAPGKDKSTVQLCSWQGFNSQGGSLRCTNHAIQHPWKTFTNVYGDEEVKTFDFCAFHQKYCIDADQRHKDDFVKIDTPNQYGLCRECYIAKEGIPPSEMKHFPGITKVIEEGNDYTRQATYHQTKVLEMEDFTTRSHISRQSVVEEAMQTCNDPSVLSTIK